VSIIFYSKVMVAPRHFDPGEKVFAKWKGNGREYGGKIDRVNPNGNYFVRYDDGDVDDNCPAEKIRRPHEQFPAIPEQNTPPSGFKAFRGDLRDLCVLKKSLSAEEIASLYTQQRAELLRAGLVDASPIELQESDKLAVLQHHLAPESNFVQRQHIAACAVQLYDISKALCTKRYSSVTLRQLKAPLQLLPSNSQLPHQSRFIGAIEGVRFHALSPVDAAHNKAITHADTGGNCIGLR
jgi:hypothetical protein